MSKRRPWLARERDLLRAHYGKYSRQPWSMARICEALGRTPNQVAKAAQRFGCAPQVTYLDTGELVALHAQGLTDPEIAEEFGVSKMAVWRCRSALGLAHNWRGDKPRQAIECYVKGNGLSRLGEIHDQRRCTEAERRGWPGARSERMADCLDLLSSGPKTLDEITVGLRLAGKHLARGLLTVMVRLSLVAVSERKLPGKPRHNLYALAPGVQRQQRRRDRADGPCPSERANGDHEPRRVLKYCGVTG